MYPIYKANQCTVGTFRKVRRSSDCILAISNILILSDRILDSAILPFSTDTDITLMGAISNNHANISGAKNCQDLTGMSVG